MDKYWFLESVPYLLVKELDYSILIFLYVSLLFSLVLNVLKKDFIPKGSLTHKEDISVCKL